MRLQNNVAIVTGAAGGLGEGISLSLASEGAHVVVCDLNLAQAEKVAEKIRATGQQAIAHRADVTKAEDCEQTITATLDHFSRLDTLVCNAGVDGLPTENPATPPLLENLLEDDWDIVMEVNLKGVFCPAARQYRTLRSKAAAESLTFLQSRDARGSSFYLPMLHPKRL